MSKTNATVKNLLGAFAMGAAATLISVGTVSADSKAAPTYSFNLGLTTDYIFRGFSQTARHATGQGGLDMTYGIFYAGLWASGLDFGKNLAGQNIARAELDLYAGFKPVVGPLTFDLGVIYYAYPGARDSSLAELDYVELKAGVSGSPWKGATLGGTLFWSPEYTGETGKVWTLEASFAQELPKIGTVTPTFSALVGYQAGDTVAYRNAFGNGAKDYTYWNAGLSFAWEKFTLDVRYWDTNIKNNGTVSGFCDGSAFGVLHCDERVVGTLKFTY